MMVAVPRVVRVASPCPAPSDNDPRDNSQRRNASGEAVVDAQKNGPIYAQGSGPMKCAEEVKLLSGKRAVKRLSCC